MMCSDHWRWPYYPRLRKSQNLMGKPKDGQPVTVERISSPKLIAKEFADICAEARNLRFDKKRRLEFEKSANAPHLEGFDVCSQRRTGLVLVENCTAWLYLHRREGPFGKTKSAVSRLFQKLRLVDDEIHESSSSPIFLRDVEDLRKDISTVMKLFQHHVHTTKEPHVPV
ncbi:hypothetical protein GCK32_016261 [Trichostrongylus colubriformis]|uniref:Uncharacterized protein n=1 Tax=Trichostrongylus colubriformis TaxID=6319 RepID=A0AAN8ESF1_TRICO